MSKHVSLRFDFKCPECGGYRFGTSFNGENKTGHCHDFLEDGTQCRFTWDRQLQDEQVFTEKSDRKL